MAILYMYPKMSSCDYNAHHSASWALEIIHLGNIMQGWYVTQIF
jgi:hypothetical protein